MQAITNIFIFSLQVLALDKRPSEFPSKARYALLALMIACASEVALGFITGHLLSYLAILILSFVWIDLFLVILKMENRLQQSVSTFLGIAVIGDCAACALYLILDSAATAPIIIALGFKIIAMHRLHRFSFRLKRLSLTTATFVYALFITSHLILLITVLGSPGTHV
ncbi:MAG: hypothetical protein QNL62_05500 [Gammaproteobacteria bacterium]|nr:hypothetical protein [Gammaproteobacteria bacterium]